MNRSLIKLYSLVLIVILFICNTGNTDAQSLKQSINSLKGVSKAGVIVEKVNQVLNDNGINEDTILKDAVEKLDSAGMTVVDKSAMHSLPGAPYLYINIGAIKSKIADVYAASLTIEFRQDVNLSRNPKQEYFGAATWSSTDVGIFSADKLKEIRLYAREIVDKFIKDYIKANKMKEFK
ncbi:MAG: hypothetical protein WCA84_03205 [Ignavibacteriaceae bacterium]|jgi:hypothetical protein